jgi:hypothetical protein
MRRMKLSRLGAGTSLAIAALIASLASMEGACANYEEPCGNAGVKTGTCQVGPTCPSGSVEVLISDPSDSCPGSNGPGGENYICCNATGSGSGSSSSAATPVADAAAPKG